VSRFVAHGDAVSIVRVPDERTRMVYSLGVDVRRCRTACISPHDVGAAAVEKFVAKTAGVTYDNGVVRIFVETPVVHKRPPVAQGAVEIHQAVDSARIAC